VRDCATPGKELIRILRYSVDRRDDWHDWRRSAFQSCGLQRAVPSLSRCARQRE
jgi:hypothetical protein